MKFSEIVKLARNYKKEYREITEKEVITNKDNNRIKQIEKECLKLFGSYPMQSITFEGMVSMILKTSKLTRR